jgi:hypothetical protein
MRQFLEKCDGRLFVKTGGWSIGVVAEEEITWGCAVERFPEQLFDLIFAGDADIGRVPATLRASQLRPKGYVRKVLDSIPSEDHPLILSDSWDKPMPPIGVWPGAKPY